MIERDIARVLTFQRQRTDTIVGSTDRYIKECKLDGENDSSSSVSSRADKWLDKRELEIQSCLFIATDRVRRQFRLRESRVNGHGPLFNKLL